MQKLPIRLDAFAVNSSHIDSIQQIFSLNDDQQKEFLDFFNEESRKKDAEIVRLYKFLESRLKKFNYYSKTLTAKNALEQNAGNCLTLAILTKSLADLVNVNIEFELVDTPPVYQKENRVVIGSQHIRSLLHEKPTKSKRKFLVKNLRIDYFPTEGTKQQRKVLLNEFYSMYYNNKAVEALVDNKLNFAFLYTQKSLKTLPMNSKAINMMALLHSRLNFPKEADELYLIGLEKNPKEEILLANYYTFLKKQSRFSEAEKIRIRLEKYRSNNPYEILKLADAAYLKKDYKQALKYYKKASRMAQYLHEPYAGIARTKYYLGDSKEASSAIIKAIANSHESKTTQRYKSKYDYFKSLIK